jgi:hypothetical protein
VEVESQPEAGTDLQRLTISGEQAAVNTALGLVRKRLPPGSEMEDTMMYDGKKASPIHAAQTLPGGDVSIRQLVPSNHVGSIIGANGIIIKSIRAQSGASVEVESQPEAGTDLQRLTISGEQAAVNTALVLVRKRLPPGSEMEDAMMSSPVRNATLDVENEVSEALRRQVRAERFFSRSGSAGIRKDQPAKSTLRARVAASLDAHKR